MIVKEHAISFTEKIKTKRETLGKMNARKETFVMIFELKMETETKE